MESVDAWLEAQTACLGAEREEEAQRYPVPTGISYDAYKGPQAFVKSLATSSSAPLRLLQTAGYAIKGLTVLQTQILASSKTPVALLGRQNQPLSPETSGFRSRDIVAILDTKLRLVCQGIIVSLSEKDMGVSVEKAVDVVDLEAAEPLTVIKIGSDLTFKYLMANIDAVRTCTAPWDRSKEVPADVARMQNKILSVLLGESTLSSPSSGAAALEVNIPPQIVLNEQQQAAVRCILRPHFLNVVWGPAGTGKTTTLSAAVALYLVNNPQHRVLVCGPSNTATDNLLLGICTALKKLGVSTDPVLRIGSTARATSEAVYPFLFDVKLFNDHMHELQSAKTDFQRAENIYRRARTKTKASGNKKQLYEARTEFYAARDNMIASQRECSKHVLSTARLVACTLSGASSSLCLRAARASEGFNLVLVDEASQALDVSLLAAILLTREKLVLAGDPKQLPPTVLSDRAMHKKAFSVPLISRITDAILRSNKEADGLSVDRDTTPLVMLEQQYRFNSKLCSFPSKEFYMGKLVADRTVQDISLADFLGNDWFNLIADEPPSNPTEIFVDTCSAEYIETQETEDSILKNMSTFNSGEAELVVKLISYFVSLLSRAKEPSISSSPQKAIGCISPYAAQISLLTGKLEQHVMKGLEISTVDGFQGREKEIIIISLVRSNEANDVGFLSDRRRLNVSITRAKRLLVIIGNSITLEKDPTLRAYSQHLMDHATILFPENVEAYQNALEAWTGE